MGLTYAISISNCFWKIFNRKHFLLFFIEFKLLTFHNNIVKNVRKFEQEELAEKLPQFYLPY